MTTAAAQLSKALGLPASAIGAPVVSSTDHGCESPAVVRPLAFGLAGFLLPGLAGLESLTKRMEAAAARDVREKRAHVANNSGKCGACRYQESLMRKRHGGAYSRAGTT